MALTKISSNLVADDAIVTGKPQKKMSREKISTLASMDPNKFTNYIRLRNWKRNAELIDFRQIPSDVRDKILVTYNTNKPRESISKHGCFKIVAPIFEKIPNL